MIKKKRSIVMTLSSTSIFSLLSIEKNLKNHLHKVSNLIFKFMLFYEWKGENEKEQNNKNEEKYMLFSNLIKNISFYNSL